MGVYEGAIQPALPQHQVQHAVEQHHIGARLDLQKQIRRLGRIGAAHIDHDPLHGRVGTLGIFNAPKQHRVGKRGVGANDEQRLRKLHIVVAVGRGIRAQRLLVAGYRAAHAQARIGVDVVGANQALGQFVEDVIVFGEQLAADVKTHGIRPVVTDHLSEFVGGVLQGHVPRDRLGCCTTLQATQGLQ